jgi:predicted Rdx family selenoprotein
MKEHIMYRICLWVILLLPFSSLAQEKLGKTKAALKEELTLAAGKTGKILIETDSTLIFSSKNDKAPDATLFVYSFDSTGVCNTEKFTTDCRDCFERQLHLLIDQPRFQWKKINANQYISRFEDKLLLETAPEAEVEQYFFTLFRADWTRDIYDLLQSKQ